VAIGDESPISTKYTILYPFVMSVREESEYLGVRETARLLGVHENTVRNWASDGKLVSSRLPGARQHRFAREDVMSLRENRGRPAMAVAPRLRSADPELVSAASLDQWASRDDAKRTFPELMRRLLAATSGISNLEVRAHEGVAAHGWDGSALSAGSVFLPAGSLRFEFGTDRNPKAKAESEYKKRSANSARPDEVTFVFATPRNWAGASAWAEAKSSDAVFAGVKAIDAHVLEGWLQEAPAVHIWLSERLGLDPRGAQSVSRWWETFQGRITVPLPPALLMAGRSKQVDALLSALSVGPRGEAPTTVVAPWRDEATAFVCAVLQSDEGLRDRGAIVTDRAVWDRLVESSRPMVLVPTFEGPINLKDAEVRGHRVVLVAGDDTVVRGRGAIVLPKVDREMGVQALVAENVSRASAEEMIALARRSMPAFLRSVGRDARFVAPPWSTDREQASVLAPLVLAGSWTSSADDASLVAGLAGVPNELVDQLLRSLAKASDAPFVLSGGVWRLASPTEAATLVLDSLSNSQLERWAEVVPEVLTASDGIEGQTDTARLTTTVRGDLHEVSATLKEHLAKGLALASVTSSGLSGSFELDKRAAAIVQTILAAAEADSTGSVWARIAPHLPSMAEAAPEVFVDAVDTDLARDEPRLRSLFRDQTSPGDFFGASSPHTHLLWALELLCWSPEHFGHAARALVRLAALDPGGRLANRPLSSISNITAGWISNCSVGVVEKLKIVKWATEAYEDVGWRLALSVWPEAHAVGLSTYQPVFRDWSRTDRSVSLREWGQYVHELVGIVVSAACDSSDRWAEIIARVDDLPHAERSTVIATLREVAGSAAWDADQRYAVWRALSNQIARHREYPDAGWALPDDDVKELESIAGALEPSRDPRRHSELFSWRAEVAGTRRGEEAFAEKLEALRRAAVAETLEDGTEALAVLVRDVTTPALVGWLLAPMDVPQVQVLGWLGAENDNLRLAASAFARARLIEGGMGWLRRALDEIDQAGLELGTFLVRAVPLAKTFWTEMEALDPALAEEFWRTSSVYDVPPAERHEAVDLLVGRGRPWAAVGLLGLMLHGDEEINVGQVKRALFAAVSDPNSVEERQMLQYDVSMLLEKLERETPQDPELAGLEFVFFRFVDDHGPSRALYGTLCANSEEFVELVCAVYRAEGEAKRKLTAQEEGKASLAWSVLREWPTLPGLRPDGSIDVAHLNDWVTAARRALAEAHRASVGDEQIGEVLAASPPGADGIWPAEAVRDIIDGLVNQRIETGLHIGLVNRRGVTSRGMFEGGDQERDLESQYRGWAAQIAVTWPRTARVLRGIADAYRIDAAWHDGHAEQRGDDG